MGKKLSGSYVYLVLTLRIKINIEINIKRRTRASLRFAQRYPQPASRQCIYFNSLNLLAALNLSFVIRQETIVLIRMSQWNNTKSHIENGKNNWPHFRFAGLTRRRGKFCAVTLGVIITLGEMVGPLLLAARARSGIRRTATHEMKKWQGKRSHSICADLLCGKLNDEERISIRKVTL